jgi:chromosome segregation ATPase
LTSILFGAMPRPPFVLLNNTFFPQPPPFQAREATKRAEQVAREARQDTEALGTKFNDQAETLARQAEIVHRLEAQLAEQKAATVDASARAAQLESSVIDNQARSPEPTRDAAEEARLNGKLQSLEEMCNSRAEQIEELRASLAASTQRFTTLASQNQSLQQELLTLRAAKEEGKDEQGSLERASSELRLQLEKKDVRIATLETELAAMQSAVDDAAFAKQEAEVRDGWPREGGGGDTPP